MCRTSKKNPKGFSKPHHVNAQPYDRSASKQDMYEILDENEDVYPIYY